jgi:hypothetical protein
MRHALEIPYSGPAPCAQPAPHRAERKDYAGSHSTTLAFFFIRLIATVRNTTETNNSVGKVLHVLVKEI